MFFSLTQGITFALKRLESCGFSAYLVGGCVRDFILGKFPDDFDITTSAYPDEICKVFEDKKLVLNGMKHGTVAVVIEGELVEITSFRLDGKYINHRHPESVSFTRSLEEDLKRRDFTINAMAYSPSEGIIDLNGGMKDIENRIIRCVGKPGERFDEDALRILRALRFSCKLDFEIEGNTVQAMHEKIGFTKAVSQERKTIELNKFMLGQNPAGLLRKYPYLFFELIPNISQMFHCPQKSYYHCYDVWEHSLHALEYSRPTLANRWAALYHDSGKPAAISYDEDGTTHFAGHEAISVRLVDEAFDILKQKKSLKKRVLELVRYHDTRFNKNLVQYYLAQLGEECFFELMELQRADLLAHAEHIAKNEPQIDALIAHARSLIENKAVLSMSDMQINARTLIDNGFKKDKNLGLTLNRLFQLVLLNEIENEPEALLKKAKELIGYKD